MNTFIKIKGHNEWFLTVKPNQNISDDIFEMMNNIRKDIIIHDYLYCNNKQVDEKFKRVLYVTNNDLDYEKLASKYKSTILVRKYGSWMTLLESHEIVDQIEDEYFPQ